MSPYSEIHWDYILYILLGGILFTALVWLAVWGRKLSVTTRDRTEEQLKEEEHQFGPVREGHRPVPLFLVVLLGLFIVWAIAYTIYSGSHFIH